LKLLTFHEQEYSQTLFYRFILPFYIIHILFRLFIVFLIQRQKKRQPNGIIL